MISKPRVLPGLRRKRLMLACLAGGSLAMWGAIGVAAVRVWRWTW